MQKPSSLVLLIDSSLFFTHYKDDSNWWSETGNCELWIGSSGSHGDKFDVNAFLTSFCIHKPCVVCRSGRVCGGSAWVPAGLWKHLWLIQVQLQPWFPAFIRQDVLRRWVLRSGTEPFMLSGDRMYMDFFFFFTNFERFPDVPFLP